MQDEVNEFLNELKEQNGSFFSIVASLRDEISSSYPSATEAIKYGGIMFKLDREFCGLFIYTKHISLEFSRGAQLNDPLKKLDGNGKFRRHLKFRKQSDIEILKPSDYLKQKNALL